MFTSQQKQKKQSESNKTSFFLRVNVPVFTATKKRRTKYYPAHQQIRSRNTNFPFVFNVQTFTFFQLLSQSAVIKTSFLDTFLCYRVGERRTEGGRTSVSSWVT